MNTFFLFAAALAGALTALAHIFIGGKKNAAPVLQSPELSAGPKITVEFAWHAASVFLIAVAAIYFFAAIAESGRSLVLVTTIHCAVLVALSAVVAIRGGLSAMTFPPTILFAAISAFGALALWV